MMAPRLMLALSGIVPSIFHVEVSRSVELLAPERVSREWRFGRLGARPVDAKRTSAARESDAI